MTLRERQTLTCIGVTVVIVGRFAAELIETPSGVEVGDDDDSSDEGGQFGYLPKAPEE